MKNKRKYRIVEDRYNGYEAQEKLGFFLPWTEIGINTWSSVEDAMKFIDEHKKRLWRLKRFKKRKVYWQSDDPIAETSAILNSETEK